MTDSTLELRFKQQFQCLPQGVASAPGRVNLIGEFTDFNNGFVFPAALQFRTQIAFRVRDDDQVVVFSESYPSESERFSVSTPLTLGDCQWGNYVRAVFAIFQRQGYSLRGMDLLIHSDVPQGAGLSSSAALEVAVAGAINEALQLRLRPEELALIGQQSENDFMGCQCGIMDQLVSATGQACHALLIDCESLSTRVAPIPPHLALLVINSNYPRKLVDSAYNQRRQDCEQAALIMGVSSLRHATLALLDDHRHQLSAKQFARTQHVISENARVLAFEEALRTGDVQAMSDLMQASHQSLKHDFEVTVPATDGLVDLCNEVLGNSGAARMTGGGFGGAIVCLCPHERVTELCQHIHHHYPQQFQLEADIYQAEIGDGLNVTTS